MYMGRARDDGSELRITNYCRQYIYGNQREMQSPASDAIAAQKNGGNGPSAQTLSDILIAGR